MVTAQNVLLHILVAIQRLHLCYYSGKILKDVVISTEYHCLF